jgi:hypothetical protein
MRYRVCAPLIYRPDDMITPRGIRAVKGARVLAVEEAFVAEAVVVMGWVVAWWVSAAVHTAVEEL